MRFLTTRQLADLFFDGSRAAANKRLRRLLDAGVVRVWLRNLNTDNVYAITPRGRRVLETCSTASPETAGVITCPRTLDGQLDHLLAINSIRVVLAMDLPDTGGVIAWWRSDWELRVHSRQRNIPDALFALNWLDIGERVFALEVEHHTRAPRRFAGKLLRYWAASYHRSGASSRTNPIVLVVGHSPAWLARYRTVLAPRAVSTNVWFASFDDLNRHGVNIWQAATSETRYSLRTLANLPYGKEGPAANSRAESRPCAADAAHTSPHPDPQ
ncbi:MAG TPA: replication-relaxation family protein [Candidatus Binatia bacterium]|nr:replication-relaxation family protein [Candidatus Binatia bacterium]